MQIRQKIAPCLWFDDQAEAAAKLYTGIFPDSRIVATSYYTEAGREIHGKKPGTVLTVELELAGQRFTALNGGPLFRFTEAISFQVLCDTQAELDGFWTALSAGGDPGAQQCGWLKDRFGVSWQILPARLGEMMTSRDTARTERVMAALLPMKKLDVAALARAYAG